MYLKNHTARSSDNSMFLFKLMVTLTYFKIKNNPFKSEEISSYFSQSESELA